MIHPTNNFIFCCDSLYLYIFIVVTRVFQLSLILLFEAYWLRNGKYIAFALPLNVLRFKQN